MVAANTALHHLSDADRRTLESWLLAFETSWGEGRLKERAGRLPAAGHPLRRPALGEMVKIDLEKQWGLNRRPGVEGYLHAYPELGTRDTVAPDLLLAEYRVRRQFGEPDPLQSLVGRFPRQAERLRSLVQSAPPSGPVPLPRKGETVAAVRSTHSQARAEGAPQELPERFGRYRIVRRLGNGAMGTVYLAEDTELNRQVALKVPHFGPSDGPEVRERFRQEARSAAALSHPNLCPVYDVGEIDGTPYLTMAYVEGATLAEVLVKAKTEGRPLAPRSGAVLTALVAQGMAAAHKKGVVHRDLKPANLMVKKQAGEKNDVVVMDFGLARRTTDPRLTDPKGLIGTPPYMPPELVRGDVTEAGASGDIYTLGVILYEVLTGQLPFEGLNLVALWVKIVNEEAPPPRSIRPELDERLEAICLKAMAKDPAERYASMGEFAAALTGWLKASPVLKPVPGDGADSSGAKKGDNRFSPLVDPIKSGKTPRPLRTPSRWRALIAMAGAAAVLLLGIVIVIKYSNRDKGTIVLEIEGAEPGTIVEIKLDDEMIDPVQAKKGLQVKPGEHRVEVTAPGYEADSITLTVVDRNETRHTLRLRGKKPPPVESKVVASYFSKGDNKGWITLNHDDTRDATEAIEVLENDEKPGAYFLQAKDIQNGKEWGWHAPEKYHGDHSSKFGRCLKYDLWTSHVDPGGNDAWFVKLIGSGVVIFVDGNAVERPVAGEWRTYTVALNSSAGWQKWRGSKEPVAATDEDIKKVLADVTMLRIRGEFSGALDTGRLAKVEFGIECAPASTLDKILVEDSEISGTYHFRDPKDPPPGKWTLKIKNRKDGEAQFEGIYNSHTNNMTTSVTGRVVENMIRFEGHVGALHYEVKGELKETRLTATMTLGRSIADMEADVGAK